MAENAGGKYMAKPLQPQRKSEALCSPDFPSGLCTLLRFSFYFLFVNAFRLNDELGASIHVIFDSGKRFVISSKCCHRINS